MPDDKRLSSEPAHEVTLMDYVKFWLCTVLILVLLMFV